MPDPYFWDLHDRAEVMHYRHYGGLSRLRIDRVDDTGPAQLLQLEGYQGELRRGVQRIGGGPFGHVPLPNSDAIAVYGGHRGFGTVIGFEDARYRARKYKGGESHASMVDGAKEDGSGGTLRMLFEGLLGWVHNIYGKTINVGTKGDTETIAFADKHGNTMVFGSNGVVINGALINLSGDLITKKGVDVDIHVHTEVMSGGSDTGPPDA